MMLSKLSHQFPYTEQLFVSQINKHQQINPPERGKPPVKARQNWCC
ncbi:hypothetical protein ZQ34_001286 [Salmonella enterica subsp. salamae]|nr:hypothetical protein [Salmonella enterica subsp. salamae]EDV0261771.1 hypothetical protein [Salmonella enterica subsp. salamae]EDV1503490.1 hypothetical protein [Salmonella enterica subsp. salamae]EEI9680378.1 hypothetical protein [Salmonella enterica]